MFQSVRPNSQIYIFHRGDSLKIETGYLVNQPIPKPKYQLPNTFGQQNLVVDLIVKIGDRQVNYNNLPANLDIADSYSNGESIVIADNREAINVELLNLKQKSTDIINSIDYHRNLINEYDRLLSELNPEFAEKQEQKREIDTLKEQMSEMSKSVNSLMESNRKLIERLTLKEI